MYRKNWALTQEELASLLAISQTAISRLEGGGETDTLETAFGLQVVFDVQPRNLFRRRYDKVEDSVMARATKLDRQLRDKKDPGSVRKQHLLASMIKRARAADPRA